MASFQCCRTAEQNHGQQHESLGHKVSEMVSSVVKKEQTHQGHNTTSQCQQSQCVTKTTEENGMTTKTTYCSSQTTAQGQGLGLATSNDGAKCYGRSARRNGGEHRKRGLLQKIKDRISGHSDSSSSSESDSDDEKCGSKKN